MVATWLTASVPEPVAATWVPGNCTCIHKLKGQSTRARIFKLLSSVPDPEPDPDPHVFGPPGSGSGSTSQRYGSGSIYHQAKIVRKPLIPSIL
jgi:hypothetical protein